MEGFPSGIDPATARTCCACGMSTQIAPGERHLVAVRHGRAEQNAANKAARSGDGRWVDDPGLQARHPSQWQLMPRGEDQARATGALLREWFPDVDFAGFSSPDVRAKATAGLLGMPVEWSIVDELAECSHGLDELKRPPRGAIHRLIASLPGFPRLERVLDPWASVRRQRASNPFRYRHPDGESLAEVARRIEPILPHLLGTDALVVTHHGVIKALCKLLLNLSEHEFNEWLGTNKIANGGFADFTNRDPETGALTAALSWYRIVAPAAPDRAVWLPIRQQPPTYSNGALIAQAATIPRIVEVQQSGRTRPQGS